MKKLLLIPLLMVGSVQALPEQAKQATPLKHIWIDKDGQHLIRPENMDKVLRDIPAEKLDEIAPYLAVRGVRMENGDYYLHAHVRGLGGGWATGVAAKWSTRVVGWGAFGVACWFEPHLVTEIVHVGHTIEACATTAQVLGTLAPTP